MIKVGNHLLQIYNSLLIAFLTLNLTMTNYCISESFYSPLTLPIFPVPFQRVAATGLNVSHLTRLAANLACQYVSSLIHQLSLFISAVTPLSHFTAEGLDFAPSLRSSIPPPGRLPQGVKAMTITQSLLNLSAVRENREGVEGRHCKQLIVNLSADFR